MEAAKPFTPMQTAGAAAKAAVLPGTALAAGGDFFSPMGAWVVPLLAGVLALFIVAALWSQDGLRARVRKWLGAADRARFWREPFIKSAAFWTLTFFALAGIVSGSVSYARANDGGVIAGNLPIAEALQRMVGIGEESLKVQKDTLESVNKMVAIEQTGEAINPRVTLANRSVAWTQLALDQALVSGDAETAQLFLQGGMGIEDSVDQPWELVRFFHKYSPQVAAILVEQRDRIPDNACLPSGSLKDWLTDERRLRLYADLCNRPAVRSALEMWAQSEEENASSIRRANASVVADRRACKSRLKRDFTIENAIGLGFPPSINGNRTIDAPEEYVAAGVSVLLNDPGLDDADVRREFEKLIDSSCDTSFGVEPVPAIDNVYARALHAF